MSNDMNEAIAYIQREIDDFEDGVSRFVAASSKHCEEAKIAADELLDEKSQLILSVERRMKLADRMDMHNQEVKAYKAMLTESLASLYEDKIAILKHKSNLEALLSNMKPFDKSISGKLTKQNLKVMLTSDPKDYSTLWHTFSSEAAPSGSPQKKEEELRKVESGSRERSSNSSTAEAEVEVVERNNDSKANAEKTTLLKTHARTNTQIHLGSPVFAYRRQMHKWMKGTIASLTKGPEGEDVYRVKYRGQSSYDQSFNQAKHVAFATSSPRSTFTIGIRVLALFSIDASQGWGSTDQCVGGNTKLTTGVIAEVPLAPVTSGKKVIPGNNNRYLIFFDTGEVQYIPYGAIFHLLEEKQEEVWRDTTDKVMSAFLKVYLHFYPKRSLLQDAAVGKSFKVRDYRRWNYATIEAIDCNILKISFDEGDRAEWIFRGSDRIEVVKNHLDKMLLENPMKQVDPARGQVNPDPKRVIAISSSSEDELSATNNENSATTTKQFENKRGVLSDSEVDVSTNKAAGDNYRRGGATQFAFKSGSGLLPSLQLNRVSITDPEEARFCFGGKRWATEFLKPVDNIPFKPHQRCSPKCLPDVEIESKLVKCVLQKPLHLGFQRQFIHTKVPVFQTTTKKSVIVYKAPCGKSLRSMRELDRYLLDTKCDLPVDTFSYDPEILNVFDSVELETDPIMEDVSVGIERRPIRVVNSLDDQVPVFVKYIAERRPSREVTTMMNNDPEFLVCCDCTDNCRNKSKCQCCQLTIENMRAGMKNKLKNKRKLTGFNNVGYDHRKLTSRLGFGLYECNSRCSCNKNTCYNSVVQHGLQVRLELFMTAKKGWGVRALDYIPGGTFICSYTGELLTEEAAQMGAKQTGDTYLMNLDFMEQVDEGKAADNEEDEEADDVESLYEHDEEDDEEFLRHNLNRTTPRYRPPLAENRAGAEEAELGEEDVGAVAEEDDGIQRASDDEDVEGIMGLDLDLIGLEDDNDNEILCHGQQSEHTNQNKLLTRSSGGSQRSRRITGDNDDVELTHTRKLLFNETGPLVLDAMQCGNIGRFINHSCEPNLFVQNVFVDSHDLRFPHVGFFVGAKCITPGTELGWDYGYELDSIPGKVIFCHCGAPNCQKRLL